MHTSESPLESRSAKIFLRRIQRVGASRGDKNDNFLRAHRFCLCDDCRNKSDDDDDDDDSSALKGHKEEERKYNAQSGSERRESPRINIPGIVGIFDISGPGVVLREYGVSACDDGASRG